MPGALETAALLVLANRFARLRTPQTADQVARTVLRVGLGGGKPQHRPVAGLQLHARSKPAFAENAVDARQVVAGDIEQQMMLEMVVHVIRRDEQPLEEIGARGAG